MRFLLPTEQPLALSQGWLRGAIETLDRGAFVERITAARERALEVGHDPFGDPIEIEVRDGVAIIPISGALFGEDSLWAWLFGDCTYPAIERALAAALAAPDVRSILLNINSPGGEVDGITAVARAIYAVRGKKPIVAFTGGVCASAAYWIGSACDRVVAEDTALLGSIGVIIPIFDDTGAAEKQGYRLIDVVSSDSPGKRMHPLDEEVLARLQTRVDDSAEIFYEYVARHRGVTAERVKSDFGRGDVMIASKAVEAGLADSVGTLEGTLAELAAPSTQPAPATGGSAKRAPAARADLTHPNRGTSMKTKATPKSKATGGGVEEQKDTTGKAGASDDAPDKDKAEGDMEQCSKCKGTGEVDGESCDKCDGAGEVKKAKAESDDEPAEASAEDKGDAADDDKDEKAEQASMAKLRAALGVGPRAGATAMWRAFSAQFVSADRLAKAERQLAALTARDTERTAREIKTSAEHFVDAALADGRQFEDKRDVLIETYIDGETAKAGDGEKKVERLLMPKGHVPALKTFSTKGQPIGKGAPEANQARGGMESKGGAFDAAVREAMKQDPKLDYAKAMDVVHREQPELYQASRG